MAWNYSTIRLRCAFSNPWSSINANETPRLMWSTPQTVFLKGHCPLVISLSIHHSEEKTILTRRRLLFLLPTTLFCVFTCSCSCSFSCSRPCSWLFFSASNILSNFLLFLAQHEACCWSHDLAICSKVQYMPLKHSYVKLYLYCNKPIKQQSTDSSSLALHSLSSIGVSVAGQYKVRARPRFRNMLKVWQ